MFYYIMSSYPPRDANLSIFNTVNYTYADASITYNIGDKRYLKLTGNGNIYGNLLINGNANIVGTLINTSFQGALANILSLQSNAVSNASIVALQNGNTTNSNLITGLTAGNITNSNLITGLIAGNTTNSNLITGLTAGNAAANASIIALQNGNITNSNLITGLIAGNTTNSNLITGLTTGNTTNSNLITGLIAGNTTNSNLITGLTAGNAAANASIVALQNGNITNSNLITGLTAGNVAANASIVALQNANTAANASIVALQNANNASNVAIVALQNANAASNVSIVALQNATQFITTNTIGNTTISSNVNIGGNLTVANSYITLQSGQVMINTTQPTSASGSPLLVQTNTGNNPYTNGIVCYGNTTANAIITTAINNSGSGIHAWLALANRFGNSWVIANDHTTSSGNPLRFQSTQDFSDATQNQMSLTRSGNLYVKTAIGVGNATPSAPLYVSAVGSGTDPSTNGIYCYNSSNSSANSAVICARTNGSLGGSPYISLDVNNVGGWSIVNNNSQSNCLNFNASWDGSGTNYMTILRPNGNVGIGTTTPNCTFQVNTSYKAVGPTGNVAANIGGALAILHGANDNYRMISCIDNTMTAAQNRFINLGQAASTANCGELAFNFQSAGSATNYVSIGTYGITAPLTITAAGNVGIGTTIAYWKCTVFGPMGIFPTSSNATERIRYYTDATSTADIVQIRQTIGSSSSYWYYNGNNATGTVSDFRVKCNIQDLNPTDSVAFLKNLRPRSFNYKSNPDGEVQCGFIAQEILAAAVVDVHKSTINKHETYSDDDPECPSIGLNWNLLTPMIVQSIQSLLKRIDTLENRVQSLEASNWRLSQTLGGGYM